MDSWAGTLAYCIFTSGTGPGLSLIRKAIAGSGLPARVFNPMHVNRRRALLDGVTELTRAGLAVLAADSLMIHAMARCWRVRHGKCIVKGPLEYGA